MKAKSIIFFAALAGLITNCSYSPDEDPGQCKLVCGSAIIAGNDNVVKITAKTLAVGTECAAGSGGTPIGPYKAAFLIGEDIISENGSVVGVRPVPNISIEPLLIGNRPTVDNENDNTPYQGLKTLKDNWCSDACGIVTLDTTSVCPGDGTSNDLSVQIHSGANFSTPMVFPISTKSPE